MMVSECVGDTRLLLNIRTLDLQHSSCTPKYCLEVLLKYSSPEVLLGLLPVLLDAEVVHQGGAAGVGQEVEEDDDLLLEDEHEDHADGLQDVVDQVELHGHHISVFPLVSSRFTQTRDTLVLLLLKPYYIHTYMYLL